MNRRQYLASAGAAAAMTLSGCLQQLPGPLGKPSVENVKENAETIPYDELYRNISSYEGQYVHYPYATITDVVSGTDTKQFIITVDDDVTETDAIWGYWDGDPYERLDDVKLWGVVRGLKEYQSLTGETTVPRIELVDIELIDSL